METTTLVDIILLLSGIIVGLVGALVLMIALLRSFGGGDGHGHVHF